MQCPSCKADVPTSFRCKACGAELMGAAPRPSASGAVSRPKPPAPAPGPSARVAARPVADVNPYAAPASPSEPDRLPAGPDEAPIQFLAGRGTRLLAQLLNMIFMLMWVVPGFLVMFIAAAVGGGHDSPTSTVLLFFAAILFLGGLGGLLIYQVRLLAREGQSWGKKQMKVRIVMYDSGEIPGLGRTVGIRYFVNQAIGSVPLVGVVYALVDILFIFGAERRCLHDLLAGTKVVEAS